MKFDPASYGPAVAQILALDGDGQRLMPLAWGKCSSNEAVRRLAAASARELFPKASHAEGAFSGLWLYFSCLDESHRISQDIDDTTGSFWHGIMHRQEPDAGNSSYWFRRVGRHPVFPSLVEEAAHLATNYADVAFQTGSSWDPFAFIDFCEQARSRPGSAEEKLALDVQRTEWQLLFDHCAR